LDTLTKDLQENVSQFKLEGEGNVNPGSGPSAPEEAAMHAGDGVRGNGPVFEGPQHDDGRDRDPSSA